MKSNMLVYSSGHLIRNLKFLFAIISFRTHKRHFKWLVFSFFFICNIILIFLLYNISVYLEFHLPVNAHSFDTIIIRSFLKSFINSLRNSSSWILLFLLWEGTTICKFDSSKIIHLFYILVSCMSQFYLWLYLFEAYTYFLSYS